MFLRDGHSVSADIRSAHAFRQPATLLSLPRSAHAPILGAATHPRRIGQCPSTLLDLRQAVHETEGNRTTCPGLICGADAAAVEQRRCVPVARSETGVRGTDGASGTWGTVRGPTRDASRESRSRHQRVRLSRVPSRELRASSPPRPSTSIFDTLPNMSDSARGQDDGSPLPSSRTWRHTAQSALTRLSHGSAPFITTFVLIHLTAPVMANLGGTSLSSQVMVSASHG